MILESVHMAQPYRRLSVVNFCSVLPLTWSTVRAHGGWYQADLVEEARGAGPGTGRRGEWRGCQCTSVAGVVTTICCPAKSVLPGGGARMRRDRGRLSLKASSHQTAGGWWRAQKCVAAGFLPMLPNGQAVRGGNK